MGTARRRPTRGTPNDRLATDVGAAARSNRIEAMARRVDSDALVDLDLPEAERARTDPSRPPDRSCVPSLWILGRGRHAATRLKFAATLETDVGPMWRRSGPSAWECPR